MTAIERYLQRFASVARARVSARAVGNMTRTGATREQVYTRNPAQGTGSLRIVSGRLSASMVGSAFRGQSESVYRINVTPQGITVDIGSSVPYAGVHEFGFTGSVSVPGHTRRITQAFGRQIAPREVQVRTHTRTANIPARPYLGPAIETETAYLERWLADNFGDVIDEMIQ